MKPDGHDILGSGPLVIPAHPLAVDDDGAPDWVSQRILTQYYLAAGATGLAVGVHTTQFDIHDDPYLLRRTLSEVADVAAAQGSGVKLVAGVCGDTEQAVAEAELAASLGYGSVLLSPYKVTASTHADLLDRARRVADVLPVLGFYMQESVGGEFLPEEFWRELFSIDGVVGVKIAPFDRYRTRDVLSALASSPRWDQVVVVTGNDDTIVADLVTPYRFANGDQTRTLRFSGGLLGQWAVGTRAAVELTREAHTVRGAVVPEALLAKGADLVTVNRAVFDPDNHFAGAVAGINELLRQQGLVKSSRCLSPRERLSPGQAERIAEARRAHPDLLDEQFIAEFIDSWRAAAA
ncbi:dihydrodipicolinate synthase family protein [Tessaracoccus sp. OS52]|uniref:dihydrodipicolinate synthase family protein n=1 Tax=Tessaracoccus sp. OS52 TaxID=2886691 RepID=UPI001D11F80A|nr:dihydrodipicolinate synthase family protein [Tessaracoccus sp. OS52]MCC2593858.1 dihydrodipicolinate synthase family protein [Tessaracoccus sp. OS52]